VACSQLAAPTPSPPAYSLHAPSGAAGETVWRHTRTHTPGESMHLPHPGVLRDAGVLKESLSALRQRNGLRRKRYSSDESSEDIDSSFASSLVVSSRPARTARSTAELSVQGASRARMAPPSPGRSTHLTFAADRQPRTSRSRRRDEHTCISSVTRASLGEPSAPAERTRQSLPGPRPRRRSRRMTELAPPETSLTTPILISSEEGSSHASLGPASSRQPRRSFEWAPHETTPTTPDPISSDEDSSHSSPGSRSSRRSQRTSGLAPPETTPLETTPTTPDPTLFKRGHQLPPDLPSFYRAWIADTMPTPSPQPGPAASVTGATQRRERR